MTVMPETITTERLTLRWWEQSDAAVLTQAVEQSLDHLMPWMPWAAEEPMAPQDRRAMIGRWRSDAEAGGDATYGVFLDGRAIGGAGLHRRRGPDALEIGYWIHADHLRRGYATEAARALTSVAFTMPGIEHVEIHHDRANVASRGVPRALGFRLVSECRDGRAAPDEVGIDCGWRADRATWAPHTPARAPIAPR